MRQLKLMADFYCFPLWESYEDGSDDIDPASLPISENLKADLEQWSSSYQDIFIPDDPASSAFKSVEDREQFKRRAYELGDRLRAELGPGYKITVRVNCPAGILASGEKDGPAT